MNGTFEAARERQLRSGGGLGKPSRAGLRCGKGVRIALVGAALVALAGCGAGSASEEIAARRSVERASVAAERAERAGAGKALAATRYLQLAERHLQQAKRLLRSHDFEGARSLAVRAAVDAELASLLAREAALRALARRTHEEASALAGEVR